MLLLWGVRDYEHRRAVNAIEALEYQGKIPVRASAFPRMTNPFLWNGVADLGDSYVAMDVDSLAPAVDPEGRARVYPSPNGRPPAMPPAKPAWAAPIWAGRDIRWSRPRSSTEPRPDSWSASATCGSSTRTRAARPWALTFCFPPPSRWKAAASTCAIYRAPDDKIPDLNRAGEFGITLLGTVYAISTGSWARRRRRRTAMTITSAAATALRPKRSASGAQSGSGTARQSVGHR